MASEGCLLVNEIIPLFVGFLLTTVLGGFLGTWLQQRNWKHQYDAKLREDELRRADDVCHQVSKLLDRRLYRMRRFYAALASGSELPEKSDRIEAALKEYNVVLYEWNDSLNVNLALMGAYFGRRARDWLCFQLYEEFKQAGADLEDYYLKSTRGGPVEHDLAELEAHLDSLGRQVYQMGFFMMTQLREGYVGRSAPDSLDMSASPEEVQLPSAIRRE
jgi:hypothetical protein